MKLASKLCSSESIIFEEFCSFDGKDGRVKNFKTLTASAYHTLLKRQIPLAIMECKHEDLVHCELFWRLFSEAYKKANHTNEKFHPTGWSTDMATSNFNCLERIYDGDILAKIKGCEFHFKDSVNKHAKFFEEEQKLTFKTLANELLIASTEEGYRNAYQEITSFISFNEKLKELLGWLNWWHERRAFIFCAFARRIALRSNLAEVVYASWKNRQNGCYTACILYV